MRDDGTHFSETYRISFRQSSRTPAGICFAKNARLWLEPSFCEPGLKGWDVPQADQNPH
ncbi:hypothetical protein U5A82_08820 [Sphingobium sp. CR2-8]|uniref:hypothetical protein n=1 Tax=Sphingobium sp. CR2-8 TaxID=1306534 RepID=UPI002DB88C9B|nr:hypothetical protein [Sphingobium sp. CR2-8]MEC3910580.1 hypothetical protein [Sphingobium sp. CR2-8]